MKLTKIIFIGCILLGVLILAIYLTQSVVQANYGTYSLTVEPSDAIVNIDGKRSTNYTNLKLTPGKHTINLSKNGFLPQSFNVDIIAKQVQSRSVTLEEKMNLDYLQMQSNAYDQQAVATKDINKRYPILSILPYKSGNFRIDYGISPTHPKDSSFIAVYISANSEAAKKEALAWMEANEYEPIDYEIVYQKLEN